MSDQMLKSEKGMDRIPQYVAVLLVYHAALASAQLSLGHSGLLPQLYLR